MTSTTPADFALRSSSDWWGTIDLSGRTLMGKPTHQSWATPPPDPGYEQQALIIDVDEFDDQSDVLTYVEMICLMDINPRQAIDAIHVLIHSTKKFHQAKSV